MISTRARVAAVGRLAPAVSVPMAMTVPAVATLAAVVSAPGAVTVIPPTTCAVALAVVIPIAIVGIPVALAAPVALAGMPPGLPSRQVVVAGELPPVRHACFSAQMTCVGDCRARAAHLAARRGARVQVERGPPLTPHHIPRRCEPAETRRDGGGRFVSPRRPAVPPVRQRTRRLLSAAKRPSHTDRWSVALPRPPRMAAPPRLWEACPRGRRPVRRHAASQRKQGSSVVF